MTICFVPLARSVACSDDGSALAVVALAVAVVVVDDVIVVNAPELAGIDA